MPATYLATISELASAAAENPPPPGQGLNYYLWLAEHHRKAGIAQMARASSVGETGLAEDRGGEGGRGVEAMVLHMERAFIELVRAGTLVIETIPMHQDYASELTRDQKANLTANGHEILDNLGMLRAILVDPYEQHSNSAEVVPAVRAVNEQSSSTREADTVETSQSAVLTCGICFDTLSCPVVTLCMHVFCDACIANNFSYSMQCPLCRSPVREPPIRDALLEDELRGAVECGLVSSPEVAGRSSPYTWEETFGSSD
ncbi:MPN domain-containing protein [Mycena sanguinolenta]|uniref:MPN domain-containing protein n=1 Tax=Mycena sanguinolenta TaxID=230812 RepID=A0A8H6ZJ81_9AGAR|nr:MPN domain-containing protein [Mycena sanguinolenta]